MHSTKRAVVLSRTLALALALAVTLSSCKGSEPRERGACTGATAQAIRATEIRGSSMPLKTLALTFDDGPGARTAELSTYLAGAGIRAAFFVNGKMLGSGTGALAKIVADGHIVANHTQTHTSLTGRSTGTAHLDATGIVSEVAQTDALVAPFVEADRFLFRPPFGDFDADVSSAIEASLMKKYVGPVGWDVGDRMGPSQAADWDCWSEGSDGAVLSPTACGDLYVEEIESAGKGIVLLHDPYFIDGDPGKGGTVDMVKYIVPILKAKGFTFVRLDDVPEIAGLLPARPPSGGTSGTGGASGANGGGEPRGAQHGVSGGDGAGASGGNTDPCARSPQAARAD